MMMVALVCAVVILGFAASTGLSYPESHRDSVTDEYHGVSVADPYRWLEDIDSPATERWIDAQTALTDQYLAGLPLRDVFRARLTRLMDYERYGLPEAMGGRYFYSHNAGLQNQAVLYVSGRLDERGTVLLDPNTLSDDGTIALSGISLTRDGGLLAYATSESGSDWQTWRVRDTRTGADLPDRVEWSKFSGAAWLIDGSGFYYNAYAKPSDETVERKGTLVNQRVYFHRLGTPQMQDELVYERPDHPNWFFGTETTDDGRYLVLFAAEGTSPKVRVWVRTLAGTPSPDTAVFPDGDASYQYLGNDGPQFYFLTDRDAPLGRIIAVDIERPGAPREIVAQHPEKLEDAALFGDRFFLTYLRDVRAEVRIVDMHANAAGEVALPGFGTTSGFSGRRDAHETFYTYGDLTTPTTVFRHDVQTGESTALFRPQVAFEPSDYTTEQIFYASKDGTRVPMFITFKKGLARDGSAPTILYGYGGFDVPTLPAFSASRIAWLERGGVYVIANIRGGSEYGEAWHDAGTGANKQRVFEDFVGAAEYLVEHRYTSSRALAISGGSNGGLLVGACLVQRPDLFGAVLAQVAVLDMLRYQHFTVGAAWAPEYGLADDPVQFATLHAYSPLHNLEHGTPYPSTLITTGDHDDRVFPAHSFKFAAALQHAQGGHAPVLIRIDRKAGHGAGKPTAKVIEEIADMYAFAANALGMK